MSTGRSLVESALIVPPSERTISEPAGEADVARAGDSSPST